MSVTPLPSRATSLTMLSGIALNEAQSWRRLVKAYTPMVYAWCRHWGVAADCEDDLVQEVFLSVFGSFTSFRRDRPGDSFRKWLKTIAHRRALDHFRREAGSVRSAGGTTAHTRMSEWPTEPEQLESASEIAVRYERAMRKIETEFHSSSIEAFRLTQSGMGAREVAERLDLTRAAVYQARYRVTKRLREELTGQLS